MLCTTQLYKSLSSSAFCTFTTANPIRDFIRQRHCHRRHVFPTSCANRRPRCSVFIYDPPKFEALRQAAAATKGRAGGGGGGGKGRKGSAKASAPPFAPSPAPLEILRSAIPPLSLRPVGKADIELGTQYDVHYEILANLLVTTIMMYALHEGTLAAVGACKCIRVTRVGFYPFVQ
jgi:hypothetical protein